jgi:hypothetical protein
MNAKAAMPYTPEQIDSFTANRDRVINELEALQVRCVADGQRVERPEAKEYMLHGAGRRISLMRRAIPNIFDSFPLTADRPLTNSNLSNVQINLHAFVMNLYGTFENLAWAFVFRHGINHLINNRMRVGMFSRLLKNS